jgi:hypothetical protein
LVRIQYETEKLALYQGTTSQAAEKLALYQGTTSVVPNKLQYEFGL